MNYEELEIERSRRFWKMFKNISIVSGILFVVIIGAGMWGCPQYKVYSRRKDGEATLRQQEYQKQVLVEQGKAKLKQEQYERQILIEDAKAKKVSAKHLAEAEIERAKGVAEANRIIGDSLKENDAYLRYLWIQGLHDGSSETIYVPTEGNLPILEATRGIKQ